MIATIPGKRAVRQLSWCVAFVIGGVLAEAPAALAQEAVPPLGLADVVALLEGGVTSERLETLVAARCVAFNYEDPLVEETLVRAGAAPGLFAVLAERCPRQSSQTEASEKPDPTPAARSGRATPIRDSVETRGQAGGTAAAGPPDLLTMGPREQADRLFDRVMTAAGSGDTAQALLFAPMAIQAYVMAEPLDADGLFHLSLVHAVSEDFAAAQEAAERILETTPTHLLGLAALAEAALAAGDSAKARDTYVWYLENLQQERSKGLEEYQAHAILIDGYADSGRRLLGTPQQPPAADMGRVENGGYGTRLWGDRGTPSGSEPLGFPGRAP